MSSSNAALHLSEAHIVWLLLWVDETVVGADISDLYGAVAVGGEGDSMGLCSLRHDDGCWRWTTETDHSLVIIIGDLIVSVEIAMKVPH